MGKRLLLIFILITASIVVIGCGKKNDYTEKAIDYLKNLDSYSCDINMKIENDKQTINYTGKQFYDKRYGYRFELDKSRVLIYKGDKISVKDLQSGLKYDTDKDFDSLFKLSFIGEYVKLLYTNEVIKGSLKKVGNEEFEVIQLDIPGNNKNISKAELYVNKIESFPKYLFIYDSKGKKKIQIEYINFKANEEFQKDIFDIT
ncbi:germination lipoprotein GerS-related protein [Clostridium thailandense]|uniref:Outer membrane lipoprotein carrier protein LolA n=1 Tax=Clostridium thailandense TaxID=2794346 RepID=A0A949TLN9_9CLOT|nr:germination lipoprotein GerS-related protein [Clostridium thailandense]MBV7271587.1 outer membrane lipoprotein carrier protein LolA [Clostridium thailandense]MCH5136443.1 outer membrane lipoprotein carrier protein LolA [Clostridiaceae bacterium UIB06]